MKIPCIHWLKIKPFNTLCTKCWRKLFCETIFLWFYLLTLLKCKSQYYYWWMEVGWCWSTSSWGWSRSSHSSPGWGRWYDDAVGVSLVDGGLVDVVNAGHIIDINVCHTDAVNISDADTRLGSWTAPNTETLYNVGNLKSLNSENPKIRNKQDQMSIDEIIVF